MMIMMGKTALNKPKPGINRIIKDKIVAKARLLRGPAMAIRAESRLGERRL